MQYRKNTYGEKAGVFMGGQMNQYGGFVSVPGSFDSTKMTEDHRVIVTYWKSFQQHEKAHADHVFKEKFDQVSEYCSETYEIEYKILWRGVREYTNHLPNARCISKASNQLAG